MLESETEIFPLTGSRRVVLHATGLLHPRSLILGGEVFTSYADITHLAPTRGALRLGTRRGVFVFWRNRFVDREGADRLGRALLERISGHPQGAAQMARMAELEEQARAQRAPRVCMGVAAVCAALTLLAFSIGPALEVVGAFNVTLISAEPWRAVVANFLHIFPGHLVVNLLVLLVLGPLAEWPLGAGRTGIIFGLAGAGAMGGCALAGYELALGASGLAAGLVGAALWLEFRAPERLSALWRIPRRSFLAMIALQVIMDTVVPFIAQAAHIGGFAGGWLGASLLARGGPRLRPSSLAIRMASLAVLFLTSLGFGVAAYPWVVGGRALAQRIEGLLEVPGISSGPLNDHAWIVATRNDPAGPVLEVALRLAERAVGETGRRDPNVLDTLAEVQFAAGRTDRALATIEEAIALAPGEPYFEEQRRRYRGERDSDDRPDPPTAPPPPGRGPKRLPLDPSDPGLKV